MIVKHIGTLHDRELLTFYSGHRPALKYIFFSLKWENSAIVSIVIVMLIAGVVMDQVLSTTRQLIKTTAWETNKPNCCRNERFEKVESKRGSQME